MKLPKLLFTNLPILMVLVALIGVSLNLHTNSAAHSAPVGSSNKISSSRPQPHKITRTNDESKVLGASVGPLASAQAATSTTVNVGSTSPNGPSNTANATNSSSQQSSSDNSSSSLQQSLPSNPCTNCPATDNSIESISCSDYCIAAPVPPSSGCGVCNTNNSSYPTMRHVCPMYYCAPLDEPYKAD